MSTVTTSGPNSALKESMQEPSPLLRLPAELRNQIYEYVATTTQDIVLSGLRVMHPDQPLTRVCRQSREEYLPVFQAYLYTRATVIRITVTDFEDFYGVERLIYLMTRSDRRLADLRRSIKLHLTFTKPERANIDSLDTWLQSCSAYSPP